ncbi:Serine/threonine-protein kinase [Spatholobus suberectus]|nr:Serine/threonine-protein kinase [Spatholobus suberectus]
MQLFLPGIFFSFLVITITLNQTPTSCADDAHHLKCSSSFQCANLKNLSYPFWGSSRPQYCGHPAFKLQCSGEVARVTIMSESYRVLEVNGSDHRLKVVRTDYWNNTCPTSLKNITIGCTFFDYGSDSQNLTLYYDCPSPSFPQPDSFSPRFNCSVNGTQMINYFVVESMLENAGSSVSLSEILGTCKSRVVVPILESEAEVLETNSTVENLMAALDNGFGVEWNANNSLCDECQNSGGHCGYNLSSSEFACYCGDGSFPSSCKSGKSGSSKAPVAIGAGVGGVVVLIVILGCVYFVVQRRRKNAYKSRRRDNFMAPSSGDTFTSTTNTSQSVSSYQSSKSDTMPPRSYYFGVQVFTYDELEEATKNFDHSRELGEGGFGTVYKVAELAFRCLQQERELRPPMDEVVEILRGIKSDELGAGKDTEVLEVRTDEVRLLKKVPPPVSPDSVVDKWPREMLRRKA